MGNCARCFLLLLSFSLLEQLKLLAVLYWQNPACKCSKKPEHHLQKSDLSPPVYTHR